MWYGSVCSRFESIPSFKMFSKFWLIMSFKLIIVDLQNNNIENVCRNCGDIVNEYCCRYYNNCCEYLNPSGCPSPSSPEARVGCRKPMSCRTNLDCPMFKQCCDTSICGPTCMVPVSSMGYKY